MPLLAVLLTSIRSAEDLNMGNYWGWPKEWKFSNYIEIFQATPLTRYLINTVVITLPAVFCAIALATLGGYALAKFKFRGNLLMFCIFVGGNFVPFQILMVPVRNMTLRFGLLDTYWALILFHLAFQTGFCTLFMRNFISTLPNALIESARVEGVNEFKIFWYIIVPLLRPALAALAVLLVHVRLERLFLGVGPGAKRYREADNNRYRLTARSMVGLLATHLGWFHRCRPSARGHVLPLAASIYRGSHARSGEVAWCDRIGAGRIGDAIISSRERRYRELQSACLRWLRLPVADIDESYTMNKSYSYDSFLYGVVYYPEQWPEAQWDSDLSRIAETGMNVVRMGEGAWSVWEPDEGRYEFALFDRALELCQKHGLEGDHGHADLYAAGLAYRTLSGSAAHELRGNALEARFPAPLQLHLARLPRKVPGNHRGAGKALPGSSRRDRLADRQ